MSYIGDIVVCMSRSSFWAFLRWDSKGVDAIWAPEIGDNLVVNFDYCVCHLQVHSSAVSGHGKST